MKMWTDLIISAYQEAQDEVEQSWKAVETGAAYLDRNFPGWEDAISIPELNMSSGSSCICGQLFVEKAEVAINKHGEVELDKNGKAITDLDMDDWSKYNWYDDGFEYAAGQLFSGNDAERYGFNIRNSYEEWEVLAYAWIFEVEKRLAAKGLLA